jgi:hypothetical protein
MEVMKTEAGEKGIKSIRIITEVMITGMTNHITNRKDK